MASVVDYVTQGTRIFFTSFKNRIKHQKYEGSAEEICQKIVKDCWNEPFFKTSTTNFPQFWVRDFGWCTDSLMKLEYKAEVHKTLRYALNKFRQHGRLTTTLTPRGKPFNFPTYSVDSLPWLIHSIRVSKFSYYAYKNFLNKQIRIFYNKVINKQTGLVKPDVHFSSMKDFSIRKSSCYDNCMVAMLAKDLEKLKLINPFQKFNYSDLIKRHFWNGKFFYDDLQKKDCVAGDANLFPFFCGIINDKKMLTSVVKQIEEAELAEPVPLKYTSSRKNVKFIWEEFLMRNYESNAIWMHMGPLYVKLVQKIDKNKAAEYLDSYTQLIEKHQNFPEVLNVKGKPYGSFYYYCAFGMLWAANYLTLSTKKPTII
jgi:hypothetical protein